MDCREFRFANKIEY